MLSVTRCSGVIIPVPPRRPPLVQYMDAEKGVSRKGEHAGSVGSSQDSSPAAPQESKAVTPGRRGRDERSESGPSGSCCGPDSGADAAHPTPPETTEQTRRSAQSVVGRDLPGGTGLSPVLPVERRLLPRRDVAARRSVPLTRTLPALSCHLPPLRLHRPLRRIPPPPRRTPLPGA